MANGNWIMAGMITAGDHPAGVAISHGDDLKQWEVVVIPRSEGLGKMWGEAAVIVEGSEITCIARYGLKPIALSSISRDNGRTWTPMGPSNLPMTTAKPCAGRLSNGCRYLIVTTTTDCGVRRHPLTIALSRPGEKLFSRVFRIRDDVHEGPGESKAGAGLCYPCAIEYEGKLYVGYSNNGRRGGNQNSAELAVIPLEALR